MSGPDIVPGAPPRAAALTPAGLREMHLVAHLTYLGGEGHLSHESYAGQGRVAVPSAWLATLLNFVDADLTVASTPAADPSPAPAGLDAMTPFERAQLRARAFEWVCGTRDVFRSAEAHASVSRGVEEVVRWLGAAPGTPLPVFHTELMVDGAARRLLLIARHGQPGADLKAIPDDVL